MTAHTVSEPHRIVFDRPLWCLALIALSAVVSAWAVYLDPVINSGAVADLQAARIIAAGQWRDGLMLAEVPLYASLLGVASGLSGAGIVAVAHVMEAVFHVALVLGFASLTAVMGGGRAAQALAAMLILLSPALNELRAAVGASAGYWAVYVWSLAYMGYWLAVPVTRRLAAWLLCGLVGLLLSVDMVLFLLIAPLWLWARPPVEPRHRLLKLAPLAACILVLLALLAVRQALHDGAPAMPVLLQPFEHGIEGWQALERALGFKLEALRGSFLDEFSQTYDQAALLAALLWMCVIGLLGALSFVYALLAAYAMVVVKRLLPARVFHAWKVHLILAFALLPVHALTGFAVAPGQAMVAALTLLAPVPLILERWWRNWVDLVVGYRWILPAVLAVVVAVGIMGLDLRTHEEHLRRAGQWLDETAAPASSVYSNSRVVAFYSGLDVDPRRTYSWRRVMNMVQRGEWREHDYLAISIPASRAHREHILTRQIDARPIKVFTGSAGGRVLIFSSAR